MKGRVPRQAIVLAAGEGRRLRPITHSVPKCMVHVSGLPLLEHVVRHLAAWGVTNLLVNLHYLPEEVYEYFGRGDGFGVEITYTFERELLGTAGTVRAAERWIDDRFVVWYADNLSNCDIGKLLGRHMASDAQATIAVHRRDDPQGGGLVEIAESGRIRSFREKPTGQTGPAWVNAGIYLLEKSIIENIPQVQPCDFGYDVFPSMISADGRLYAHMLTDEERLWWSDNPDDLFATRRTFGGTKVPGRSTRRDCR